MWRSGGEEVRGWGSIGLHKGGEVGIDHADQARVWLREIGGVDLVVDSGVGRELIATIRRGVSARVGRLDCEDGGGGFHRVGWVGVDGGRLSGWGGSIGGCMKVEVRAKDGEGE